MVREPLRVAVLVMVLGGLSVAEGLPLLETEAEELGVSLEEGEAV